MDPDVWRIHAWGDPDLEAAMIRDHVVAVGGHELGDLSYGPTLEDLRHELRERFPDRPERGIANFVGYWRQFLYDMRPGDLVALSLSGSRVASGRVTGGYAYRPSAPDRIRHARAVEWLAPDLPRARFDRDIKATLDSRGAICRIRAAAAHRRLLATADTGMEPRGIGGVAT